ncbi:MAG: uracil-DNA glycosylase [Proteobacteria bacterium]|nr:uracil-DNA glycosylase [Pseudomonadota bacterium]
MEQKTPHIDCRTCQHFYVTWDKRFPKGCKAMGFKCREMPSLAVFKSSGVQCLYYEVKETKSSDLANHS